MNENIDLTKILKDCPIGCKFYSSIYGEVEFIGISYANSVPLHGHDDERYCPDIERQRYPIRIKAGIVEYNVSRKGRHKYGVGECTLFPSKKQRDWSKFTAPLADEHPANVWHDAKEKPRTKEWILIQFSGGDYEALALDELGVETWSDWWCDNYKVIRYAYIKDLLPKKGGKQ